jgi:sucrose-phosphate synthase
VATDSGGPNDIIEMCGNGILVDPHSPEAIAEACLRILDDPGLWQHFAAAGARAVRAYDWKRHAKRYGALLRDLLAEPRPAPRFAQLLVTDIDNTLVGCAERVKAFGEWRGQQSGLGFGVATGRSFHSAMAILEQQDAPRPQVMITSVGSEIYHLDANGTTYTADAGWRRLVSRRWDREAAREALRGLPGLEPQAPLEQRLHKLSYFTAEADREAAHAVRRRLEEVGLHCSVIHSHGRYLDVLPAGASKGTAVDHVRRRLGLAQDAVFVAGDSGNDIEMLRTVPQSIIVANFSDGLPEMPELSHSYLARETFAAGVIEGVRFFRRRNGWTEDGACAPAF